jgi:hypothetical protein
MAGISRSRPVRGTQTLVDQMGWVLRRPSLTLLEIAWRWIFGIPFLWVCWQQGQRILAALPPSSTGLTSIDTQNPWIGAVQLANVWDRYEAHVAATLTWLVPLAALVWVVVSAIGRAVILPRIEPGVRLRPVGLMGLQAGWLIMLGLVFWGWLHSVQWAAAQHINASGEPDLIGYSMWAIFLSLGFFTLWALVSWPFAIAPMLMVLEKRSAISAFGESFRLERAFRGKLMEINLVMGIVKIALIVLTMVFSAAPLPFSDELGASSMHVVWAGASVFYLVASDYFQVVRMKSFIEFWRTYRPPAST